MARGGARAPRRAGGGRRTRSRCSRRRCDEASRASGASVGDPLPPRLGGPLQVGRSTTPAEALELAEQLGRRRASHAGPRGPGRPRLVPRRAGGATRASRRVAPDLAGALGGDRLVQEATQAIVNTLAVRRAPARCSSASTASGASATSRGAPARSGASPGSSCGPGAWSSRPSTPLVHTTSRSSTASRCRRTTSRSPSLPSTAGELDLARAHSERALELAEEQFGLHPPQHIAVLGLVALWSGDPPRPREWLERADRSRRELGWREPSLRWWTPDHVELLLGLGELDDGGPPPRHLGGGRGAGRPRVGARARDALQGPRRGRARRRRAGARPARAGGCRGTRPSAIRSAGHARCSPSAPSGGAPARSGPPARRSRPRSRRSRASARRAGPTGRGRELGAIGGRQPGGRADAGRAPCRGARRRGPDEPARSRPRCSSASGRWRAI